MPHIHVFLVAPLGAGDMAAPGADRHEGRVSVRETANYAGPSADLPVEPFNSVIGADPTPVFKGGPA